MSKTQGSVAPKERVNIKYVPATGCLLYTSDAADE